MKNRLLTTSLLLLAAMGVLFASCKKEYPQPPIQNLPIGTVYTIDEIVAMTPGTVFDTASVYGIVTADEQSGNLYKAAYIQDRATGAAIQLYLNAVSGVRIGDSVRIYLKDVKFDMYHGLPQLSEFGPDGHIIILANNRPIQPEVTTLANVNSGQHLAQLIRLEGVTFVDQEGTFAPSTGYGEHYIQDAFGNTAMVRTSNYANFANNPLPQGTGNLVAIASVYNTTWQLTLRSYYELEFDGMGPGPITPGEVQSLPYTQLFSTAFGSYMTYSVLGDDQFWKIDYSSAVMTGHEKIGDQHFYYENEDWLISSPVKLTDVDHVKAIVSYAAQYSGPSNNDVTMQVSNNYVFGTDPTEATWTELSVTYPNSSGWNFQEVESSLDEFLGQTVTVAIKFVSSASASRTFEVQSISIVEGEAGGGPTPPTPGTLEGDGTRENPYTANDVILLGIETSDGNKYWVKDFIVGVVNSNYEYVFTSDTDVNTNLILSSNVDASNESECVPVQLPYGDVRTGLNLVDNPNNLGQEVLLYGTLEKYFRVAAVKNVTYAEINGNSYGTDPSDTPTPPDPGTTEYFNQTLTTQDSYNTFTAYSVAGDQEWYQNSSHLEYGAVMSGYANNTSYANEDWFISPAIDLSGSTNPILTFDHARGPAGSINVGVTEGYYTVWVTNDYNTGDDPTQVTWVELTGVIHGTTAWAFVNSGNLVIPAEFKTATCRIAFRYLSIDGASATWEVKNVVVREQ